MLKEIIKTKKIKNVLKNEFPDVPFKLQESTDFIYLMIFVVKASNRRQGIGTKFIKRLIELAKNNNKDIFLTPDDSYSDKGDMNKQQLIKWYKKLGFEKKHKDDYRVQATYCYYVN